MGLGLVEYMRAYMRLHVERPAMIGELSDVEVAQSFWFLPTPKLSYDAWLLVNGGLEENATKAPAASKEDVEALFNDPALSGVVVKGDS